MKQTLHPSSYALLALAGLAFPIQSARAAVVPAPVNGDLFIGFRASGGQGASSSYLVDIGPASSFPVLNGTSFSLSTTYGTTGHAGISGIGADLTALYGANWATRADLFWGVFGHNTSPNSTVYASRARDTVGVIANPWPALGVTERNSTDSYVGSVISGVGYESLNATNNNPYGAIQANGTGSSSYNYEVTAGATDFGTLSSWSSIEAAFGNGPSGAVLDLFRLSSSTTAPVSYRGAFSIGSSGDLAYTFQTQSLAPVPEPATTAWGLMAFGAMGLRRSRSRGKVAL